MIVKVCGVRDPRVAELAVDTGADWIGMVFEPRSPRHVDEHQAAAVAEAVAGRADLVGVVVDATPELCEQLASRFGLSAMQVHGDAAEESLLAACTVPVIRAFNVASAEQAYQLDWPPEQVVLLDAAPAQAGALPGGTGTRIPVEVAAAVARHRRIVLAGGITADNVADTIERVRPYGVDASTGLESSPGVKDPDRVRSYVRTARAAFDVLAQQRESSRA
jgi:phosphoribosylanthranilate isomerase